MPAAEPERETPARLSYFTYLLQWVGVVLALLYFTGVEMKGQRYGWLILAIGLYLSHIAESMCCSGAERYFGNVMSEQDFMRHIEKMQKAWPKVHFHIECYHSEEWCDMETGGMYQVSVVTHTADMDYPVGGFIDETLSLAQMMVMFHLLHDGTKDLNDVEAQRHAEKQKKELLFMLVHFDVKFHAASEACERHFRDAAEHFYSANRRDAHQSPRTRFYVDGQLDDVLVCFSGGTPTATRRPWWVNWTVFFLSCCLLCSIPYRHYLFSRCRSTHWSILKHFSPRPLQMFQHRVPMKSHRKQEDAAARAFLALPRESAGSGPVEGGCGNARQEGRVPPGQTLHEDPGNAAEVSLDEVTV